jgi:hypothetical protein
MPLGPPLKVTDPAMHVTVFGGAQRPEDPECATVPIVRMADLPAPARAGVERTIAEHLGDEPWPARRPPWFRQGWLEEVQDWIDDRLRALSLVAAAPAVPARVWSLSAVLRVPLTNGADVWFKASCDHFRAEPAITRAVGTFGGSTVPTVLASDDVRAWMLLAPLPATSANGSARVEATVTAMARLQLESLDHVDALRAAGCPVRDLRGTLDVFSALLAERGREPLMWPWIEDRVGTFFEGGVPLTLVHGDLHLDNVAGDDELVIYDWSDGCISHPFLDGAHVAHRVGAAHQAAIRDIYLGTWGEDARTTWDLAPLVNYVFQAVTHHAIGRSLEQAARWETAGPLERFLIEIEGAYASR